MSFFACLASCAINFLKVIPFTIWLVFPFLLRKQQFQARAVILNFFELPFGAVGEVVVRDQRENGDQESRGGGDQRLGNAPGDRMGLSEASLRHDAEGTDHAGDGPQQTQKRSQSDDGVENSEALFENRDLRLGGYFQGFGEGRVSVFEAGG